jgi:hypothetical protein
MIENWKGMVTGEVLVSVVLETSRRIVERHTAPCMYGPNLMVTLGFPGPKALFVGGESLC